MTTFFEDNVLQLEIFPNGTIGLPALFNPNAASAAYWPLSKLERVHLYIGYYRKAEGNFVSGELEKLCKVLQQCTLAQLRITAYCEESCYSEEFEGNFEQLLAPLEALRDTQDLVFDEDPEVLWDHRLRPHRILGSKGYVECLRGIVMQQSSASPEEAQKQSQLR